MTQTTSSHPDPAFAACMANALAFATSEASRIAMMPCATPAPRPSMNDRVSVNVGAAHVVAEPTPGRAGEVALFVEDAAGRSVGRRKFGAFIDTAFNVLGAAQGEVFGSAVDADAWLGGQFSTS